MDYPEPIGRDEKLRRKWWKFLVTNGHISPSKIFSGKVKPNTARSLKRLSACNGEGTQFEYSQKTGEISGYFRDKGISPGWKSRDSKYLLEMFSFIVSDGLHKRHMARMKKEDAANRHRMRKEIRATLQFWNLLNKERKLLITLSKELRKESWKPTGSFFPIFRIGKDYFRMIATIEQIREAAKEDLDNLYLLQIETLQKLISKKTQIK